MIGAMRWLSSTCSRERPKWVVSESSAWKPISPPRMMAWLSWTSRDGRGDTETEATGTKAARRRELSAICPGSDIAPIDLPSFASCNLTKRGRCLAVIGTKRWLYSTARMDRYGRGGGPDQGATAGRRHERGAAQRPLR